ncbi:MAG: hypothetical protein D3908_03080 [Candidatus Electrothrix sp. AUS4]|nr:hypothetical protein [Candidatus Electrothrix sp. AUS4]
MLFFEYRFSVACLDTIKPDYEMPHILFLIPPLPLLIRTKNNNEQLYHIIISTCILFPDTNSDIRRECEQDY